MNVLERDFFTDPGVLQDPLPYYAALRDRGPVWREPHRGVFMLSGIEEILGVYADTEHFSAIVSSLGPLVPLPKPDAGESWAEMIERRRHEIPMADQLIGLDPPKHTRHRALVGKLFTPNRLKENEEFMWTLADGLIDELAGRGEVEFCHEYARPFTLLVIADLLGVPRADHETFRGWLGGGRGNAGDPEGRHSGDRVFANLHPYFARYIEARRTAPGDDAMSRMAAVRFPDGELPEVADVVRIATILFAAGQETTARLLAAGMRILAEQPALAEELRRDPGAVPNFVEECLRLESPIKGSFRLALEDVVLAGVHIPAGSIVMALVGAANRDARVFDDPDRFDPQRPNVRRNIAFGHGEHFCPGASLARAEARISFERLLARLGDLRLADPSALVYAPTFIIRGLDRLPLRFRRRA
jgi:cytochrome P450 family 150 subfamily A5